MSHRSPMNGDRAIAECNAVAKSRFGKGAYRAFKIGLGYTTMYLVPIESQRDPKAPGPPSVAVREFCRLYEGTSESYNLSTVVIPPDVDGAVPELILKASGEGAKIEHCSLQLTGGFHPTWVARVRIGDKQRWAVLLAETGQVDLLDSLPSDVHADVKELRPGDEKAGESSGGQRKKTK